MTADTLEVLVAEMKAELAAETPIRLHTGTPVPASREPGDATYGHMTGLPFTAAFSRRIGHRDHYGINELALDSLGEVGDWCRSRHASDLHRSPGRPTALCQRIVSGLTEFGAPLGQVAWREGLDEETTYALAVQALRHAAAYRHRELHRFLRSARESERDSVVRCPQCAGRVVVMRRRRAA